jgi:membrane-bound lytic murein transglycosylase D
LFRKRTWQVIAGAAVVTSAAVAVFIRGADLFTFDDESPTEVSSPLPDALSNVLSPTEELTSTEVREGRPWRPTDFSDQTQALGWGPATFDVPASMRKRVDFWKRIYSKYSTDQGVLHDPVTLDVYEAIQFAPIRPGDSLSANARAREKLVDARRAEISERLLMLQERLDKARAEEVTTPFDNAPRVTGPQFGLGGDDLRYWKMFEDSGDPARFKKAAARIRFQLGQSDKILLGIYESGRYLKAMEKIFREEGLPIELTRLPFVESSFNTHARSKVGASGIWQFMRKTARPYLKINSSIDERNDPLTSTRAAARLMKNNFGMLGTWPLAVTAWNHGPSGVRGISQKLGTTDLAEIVNTYTSRTFGFASQNFYACFLAILEIESDAKSYFKRPVWQPSFDSVEVKAPRWVAWTTIVKLFDGDERMAQAYNPQFTAHARSSRPRIPNGTRIRVPSAVAGAAPYILAGKKVPAPKPTATPVPSPPPAASPTSDAP